MGVVSEEKPYKICPISGKPITEADNYACFYSLCSNVDMYRWSILNGFSYRCDRGLFVAKRWQKKKIVTIPDIIKSLELAKSIEYCRFIDYCEDIDKKLKLELDVYGDNRLKDIGSDEGTYIVIITDRGLLCDIFLVNSVDELIEECKKTSGKRQCVAFCNIEKDLADAVIVRECIKYGFDTQAVLSIDNPVYIRQRDLGEYMHCAYGISWMWIKKILDKHPTITSIKNADNTIYIKQEIEKLVENELNK